MVKRGLIGAAAVAAALLAGAQAQAAPVTATIRAEGLAQTVVPQTTLTTDSRSFTDEAGVSHLLPGPMALGLLFDAATPIGVPIHCTWDVGNVPADCYPFVIGTTPLGEDDFWNLVVNDRDALSGAANQVVNPGDHIVFEEIDFTLPEPPLLELTPSSDKLTVGSSFTVAIKSFDTSTGIGTPAVGARVTYGSEDVLTDASGNATLFALPGPTTLAAAKDGAIRAGAMTICGYSDDPTVCNLPKPTPAPTPAPAPAPPAAPSAPADTVPPSARITSPRLFTIDRHVTRIGGVVAPDRSDIASVQFALAKRVGTLCRFRQTDGSYGPASACSARVWLPARGGAFWTANLHAPLTVGRYRVFARATDGAGNVESTLVTGASSGSFTVR
jgi:hypothetical protein